MLHQNNITSIRILPNDKNTFQSEYEFKYFIENTMPKRGGYYYFPNLMMKCSPYTLVLFQYNGKIRAFGILLESQKARVFDEKGSEYAGYYKFDTDSLHFLEIPITAAMLKNIYPKFVGFNQIKQQIPIEYIDSICNLLA